MDASEKKCLVKVDKRHYRVIAKENWGLTWKQMRGMHVHHRIPLSKGGTNDPSNLYVCSPGYHQYVWHGNEYYLLNASKGGFIGGTLGGATTKNRGVGIFAPGKQSEGGKEGGRKGAETCRKEGLGLFALTVEQRSENTKEQWKDPEYVKLIKETAARTGKKLYMEGKGCHAIENKGKGAKVTNSTIWMDPDHPELGSHHFNVLKKKQRERGYPDGKENRVKVEE